MAVLRGSLDRALFTDILNKVFGLGYNNVKPIYPQLFNVQTSDRATEKDLGMVGLPPLVKKNEFGPIAEGEIASGYSQEYIHLRYALGIRISYEALRDEQYGQIKKATKQFGRVTNVTFETLAAIPWNNAFDAAHPWTSDTKAGSKALCAVDHPLLGVTGGTWANRPAVDVDMGVDGLQAMLTLFRKQTDQRGVRIVMNPTTVLIPIEMEWSTAETLESPERPDTAERATNVVKGKVKPLAWHYLTSATNWFLKGGKDECEANWWNRDPVETMMEEIAQTGGDEWYGCTARVSCGFSDPRGVIGTQ